MEIGTKYGSLQQFIESDGCIEDYGPDMFSIDEIQKIAILDLRILNLDRNSENILVKTVFTKKGLKKRVLIPIDHGLSLSANFEICSFDICWFEYSQVQEKFSDRAMRYIRSIDIMKDIEMLDQTFKIRPICLRNFRIANTLLKKGVEGGLTMH